MGEQLMRNVGEEGYRFGGARIFRLSGIKTWKRFDAGTYVVPLTR